MHRLSFVLIAFVALFTGCKNDDPTDPGTSGSTRPNILLIIADDLGKDAISGFSEGTIKPTTPNIDQIRNTGLSFTNFWVHPTCSPTRASVITGKYGYRTGVKWAGDVMSPSEQTLQDYVSKQTNGEYATALVGKWHLSGNAPGINPEDFGIDYYAGLLSGGVQSYFQWDLSEDGASSTQSTYITKKFTDLAIDWVDQQNQPWFLWLAYTAPHTPFHAPPESMHSQGSLPDYTNGMDPVPYYMAAIEAMDFQIGRLLESMSDEERTNTIILFIGDNGTPNQVAQLPYTGTTVKGSLYQGGINTPLFISGPGVNRIGEEDNNLVTGTDLFATIANLAGTNSFEIYDSKSIMPLLTEEGSHRSFQYSEKDDGTVDIWTISNGQYKIIANAQGSVEMYDLSADPYEKMNLFDGTLTTGQSSAKKLLEDELKEIRN